MPSDGFFAFIAMMFPNLLRVTKKKYTLSSINKNARFRTFEDSLIWLNEAMVVNACFNATDPSVGLALSMDNSTQKCYMADTGLLITHAFMDSIFTDIELYKAILFDKLDINEGMIMENIVHKCSAAMDTNFISIHAVTVKCEQTTWRLIS